MNVYICTDHDIYYPVGGASVVIAENEAQARELLDAALKAKGLKTFDQAPYTLVKVDMIPQALVLRDGDY